MSFIFRNIFIVYKLNMINIPSVSCNAKRDKLLRAGLMR